MISNSNSLKKYKSSCLINKMSRRSKKIMTNLRVSIKKYHPLFSHFWIKTFKSRLLFNKKRIWSICKHFGTTFKSLKNWRIMKNCRPIGQNRKSKKNQSLKFKTKSSFLWLKVAKTKILSYSRLSIILPTNSTNLKRMRKKFLHSKLF